MRTHMLPELRRAVRGGVGWAIALVVFGGIAARAQTVAGDSSIRFPAELPFVNGAPDLQSVPVLAGGNVGGVSALNNLGGTNLVLKSSVFGHNVEHLAPDAYLGDALTPPVFTSGATVVWSAMTNGVLITPTNSAFFEPSVCTVYAAAGGEVTVHWVLSNGSTVDTTYVVEAAPAGRPYRVYWTDRGAPKVNLSGKFVKFHYNSQISAPVWTNYTDVNGIVHSNVAHGLYIDDSGAVNAVGGQQGMIVMQYFKNGMYSDQLSADSVIVIEVMPPDNQTLDARLGERILPQGGWSAAQELTPEITAGLMGSGGNDDTFLYQHTSSDGSAVPKDGWVFPIRRSVDDPWDIEIYWKVADLMGTLWFYEVDNYAAEWPECHKYVRGDGSVAGLPIFFPSNYSVSVMAYQEPDDGCAKLQDPYTLVTTTNSGRCLVQLTTDDEDVWFLPLELITRTDPTFDLSPSDWMISREIAPFATARSVLFPRGTEAQVTLAPSGMALSTNFTLECWVMTGNLEAQTNSLMTVFDKNTANGSSWSNQVRLSIQAGPASSPGYLTATMGSGRSNSPVLVTMTSTNRVYSYQWSHLALTLQGSTFSLYVDGSLGCRTTLSTNGVRQTNSSPIYLGAATGTNAAPLDGFIDNIRVWDVALSASQVQTAMGGNYHGYSLAQMSNAGLRAYFPIDASDTLPELHDRMGRYSGSGNDLCYLPDVGAVGMRDSAAYSAFHGYIYQPFGDSFNTGLYHEASSSTPDSTTAIYGVNTNSDLEVWWSQAFNQPDMPMPVYVPNWVQRYHNIWPEADESPMIVLASGQGSKQGGIYNQGYCVAFPTNGPEGSVVLRRGSYFEGDCTVAAWIYLDSLPPAGRVLPVFSFGNSATGPVDRIYLSVNSTGTVQFTTQNGTATDSIQGAIPNPTGRWIYVMAMLNSSAGQLYIDNALADQKMGMTTPQSVIRTNCYIGSDESTNRFWGRIDEFRIWDCVLDENERSAAMYGQEQSLKPGNVTTHLSFDPYKGNLVVDLSTDHKALVIDGTLESPGAPAIGSREYTAEEAASIYYQNDSGAAGFNPNEEHAILNSEDGYDVVYAFRDDLNAAFHESEPFVLVNYTDPETGRPAMDALRVIRTSAVYQVFKDSTYVGNPLDGPHPLDLVPDHWTGADLCHSGPGWRARDYEWFAVAAGTTPTSSGTIVMGNYYPMQQGFWFPGVPTNRQPAVGTAIPWLPALSPQDYLDDNYPTSGIPTWVTWTTLWPDGIPVMKIGDTLTTARDDLPDVWDQLSVDVAYQQSTYGLTNGAKNTVVLFDPICAQGVTITNALSDFGFETGGADPSVYVRNGLYYFYGVPPDLAERFYYNPYLASNNLILIGQYVEPLAGNPYLLVNKLDSRERDTLRDLVATDNAQYTNWLNAIEKLATDTVEVRSNQPFTSVALHAPGTAAGYVVLAFNNATNPAMGIGSSPIQLSLIQIVTNLADGAVIPEEDPYNILSEQMSMLFTLDFGGKPGSYEFEWRWAEPNANGTTPTDPLACEIYTNGTGINRLILDGTKPEDLVNRFFAVRYRALSNEVVNVVGTNWSSFTEFSLAEGWVQRILNALTPFEQRMRDLYNNAVETQVSMISQAGPPYEGQVALTPDNLDNVGLIQLYKTILNRANEIFKATGMHDADANQQLLLAASRLNDLDMLLGNEAYADALNPTIGFGSTAIINGTGVLPVDYGSIASSLFCFDNQVPNLLEEELSLLRGRSNPSLAPGMKTTPIYNRLFWNYTKGITAGEVAYSVNYDITGHTNSIIDAVTAKKRFPQGHGDAWGYYLDAVGEYYQLLRNPDFDWGVPSISPMLIDDLTVDADYYDEKKFAESGAALARAGVEIIDRTFRENYDASQTGLPTGYEDSNTNRAWGIGQWASRVGVGALCNWAVGNSLLPVSTGWQTNNSALVLNGSGYVALPTNAYFDGDFTLEMWLKPYNTGSSADIDIVQFSSTNVDVVRVQLMAGALEPALAVANSNYWTVLTSTNSPLSTGQWSHVALVLDGTQALVYINGTLTDRGSGILSPVDAVRTDCKIGVGLTSPYNGAICEFRVWGDARTSAEISSNMNRRLSGGEAGLVAYWPASEGQGTILLDRSGHGLPGIAQGTVAWTNDMPAMVSDDVYDNSDILAINRATVTALPEITAQMGAAQALIDKADRGLNPLGLGRDSIPFDIDPLEIDDGNSHFEQILARAEKALRNAKSVFDAVQDASRLLRQQQENANNFEAAAISQESDYTRRLIELYGYPYSDDIGAGKTYPQGYSGPDLYHYMYVDMSALGWSGEDIDPIEAQTYTFNGVFDDGDNPLIDNPTLTAYGYVSNAPGVLQKDAIDTITFHVAANGLPCKPTEWSGSRRAEGRIQMAYAEFLKQLLAYRQSLETYEDKTEYLIETFEWYRDTYSEFKNWDYGNAVLLLQVKESKNIASAVLKIKKAILQYRKATKENKDAYEIASIPSSGIYGLASGGDVFCGVRAVLELAGVSTDCVLNGRELAWKLAEIALEFGLQTTEYSTEMTKLTHEWKLQGIEEETKLGELVRAQGEQLAATKVAYQAMVQAAQNMGAVEQEGQRLLATRERDRSEMANRIASARYNDMAFRIFRDDAISRYSSAFDLAAMYTFLAAKAYDYETGLLPSDASTDPGSRFLGDVVRARTIGRIDASGEPQVGGSIGEPGLADILARMKANWSVLDGRLGFNNPSWRQTSFSLRTELLRIVPGSAGDADWRTALTSYKVDDLFAVPEFRRYCIPFAAQGGLRAKEPGFVIPFSTTVDFGYNFFGRVLAGGDHMFSSTEFATKIRSIGIWFSNYNANVEYPLGLANTPEAYLIPAGVDVMRSPTDLTGKTLRSWQVMDQAIPVPYSIGAELNNTDWIPLYDSLPDPMNAIRRYNALRACDDTGAWSDTRINYSSRLIGRSVWNSQWYLIIPAGSLNGDRSLALDKFINGKSGDGNGVKDIKLLFETYSYSGH